MANNIIKEKTYNFAISIINLYKFLIENKKEYVLSKQLLRSGTSVGANVEEAIGAQSKKEFIAKLSIAYKESLETYYWLKLLKDTSYISKNTFISLEIEIIEISKILISIQKTASNNLKKINH